MVVEPICTVIQRKDETQNLRNLLLHKTGADNIADMTTIRIVICATYRKPYQKIGFMTDDGECIEALQD